MKKRPFQFTLRTMLVFMAATAGTLGLLLWLGARTAPFLLTPVGATVGYLLSRRDAPFLAVNKLERIIWVVSWGVIGLAVGNVVALSGTELVGLAVFFGVLAFLLFGLSLFLMVSDRRNAAASFATPPGRLRQTVVGTILLFFLSQGFRSAVSSGNVVWACVFGGACLLVLSVLIRLVVEGRKTRR